MKTLTEEQKFLNAYDPGRYKRPSVTADITAFTLNREGELELLLIKRGGHPFKGCWALPGGFLKAGEESIEETARRELFEETGVTGITLNQLATFSKPGRDPRTDVLSVAHIALVPKGALTVRHGDDAVDAGLFRIIRGNILTFTGGGKTFTESDLAFDHAEIIHTALTRLEGRADYTMDAFSLLEDSHCFTIHELKQAMEQIKGVKMDNANFRKKFQRDYIRTGLVEPLDGLKPGKGHKAARTYAVKGELL